MRATTATRTAQKAITVGRNARPYQFVIVMWGPSGLVVGDAGKSVEGCTVAGHRTQCPTGQAEAQTDHGLRAGRW